MTNSPTEPPHWLPQLGALLPVVATILASLLQAAKALRSSEQELMTESEVPPTGPTELELQFGALSETFLQIHRQLILLTKWNLVSMLTTIATMVMMMTLIITTR